MIRMSNHNYGKAFSYRKYFILLTLVIFFVGSTGGVFGAPAKIFDAVSVGENLLKKKRMILKKHPEWTPERRMQFEERVTNVSRKWESKRQDVIKKVHGMIKSLVNAPPRFTGTAPWDGRGIIGDVDFSTLNRSEVRRVAAAYRKLGYTVVEAGGSVTIKELNTTYFRPVPGGINSEAAFYDPEVMDIRKVTKNMSPTQVKSIQSRQVGDNFKKMHGYGTMDPKKFLEANPANGGRLQAKGSKLQELAKATIRIEDAQATIQIEDAQSKKSLKKSEIITKLKAGNKLTMDEKIAGLRHGIEMDTLGITGPKSSNDEILKAVKEIQKECWKRARKGNRFKARLDREISSDLKSSYKKMMAAAGDIKGASKVKRQLKQKLINDASKVKRQLVQHKIHVARGNKALLKNKGFDDLASINGYKKTIQTVEVKNPKTGKMMKVKKTYFKKNIPIKDPKTGQLTYKNKQYTRAQVNKMIRKANIKAVVRANQIGSRNSSGQLKTNISKNIKISKADIKSYQQKKIAPPKNKIGSAFLMGIAIFHGGKQAIDEISLEITEDTTDLEIVGKIAKVYAKTAYYASGLGAIEQVADNVFNQEAEEYERRKAAGKNPDLRWAYAKGYLRTVNDLGAEMIKGVSLTPLVQSYKIVEGLAGTINSTMEKNEARTIAAEMEERVISYKKDVALRGRDARLAFARLKGPQSPMAEKPEDGADPVTDLDIAYGKTLEENIEQAQKEYKAALDKAGGKKTVEANRKFKKLEQHIAVMERYIKDPGYERKTTKQNANIKKLNEKIAILTRQNQQRASGIDPYAANRNDCDSLHRAGAEVRKREKALEDARAEANELIELNKKGIEVWKARLRSKEGYSKNEVKIKINAFEESLENIYSAVENGKFRSPTKGVTINGFRNSLKLAEEEELKYSSLCYDKPAPRSEADQAACDAALSRLAKELAKAKGRIKGTFEVVERQIAQNQEALEWWQDYLNNNGTGYTKEESSSWMKTHAKNIKRIRSEVANGEYLSQSNAYSLNEQYKIVQDFENELAKQRIKCYGGEPVPANSLSQ